MSDTRDRVLELLRSHGCLSAVEINQHLGASNVRPVLRRMAENGDIAQVGYGPARGVNGEPKGGPQTRLYELRSNADR